MPAKRLAIIGDFNASSATHAATDAAIGHANALLHLPVDFTWVPTESILENFETITQTYDAYWIAPGSPYKSFQGVMKIIEFARLNKVPAIGTCGGFQHMVIEFARNVLQIRDAAHAEYDPYASKLVINPLSCSLAGQTLEINLTGSSKAYQLFGTTTIKENYYCHFGLNPSYEALLHNNGFRITGTDNGKEARILELDDHPFFMATLFVPQINSGSHQPHPLITGFLKSI